MAGLSEWANVRAFGFFESGNGADPPRGGGTAGQINTVDYITGMPDLRTEHLHAIDLVTPDGKGFDRCRIVWKGECIDYEGLAIDWPNVPDSTNNQWADEVYACAWGEEWINPAKPYMNFPPALWANNNDTLAGEGVGSNFASNQVLANNALTGGTSWSGANGFVVGGSNTAVYTHNASGGTLTQTTGNFVSAVVASKRYILTYQVTASTIAGTLSLGTISSAPVSLPITVATHQVRFTSAASAGNFVITAASSSGGITLDNIFLTIDMQPGADKRPRPMITTSSNGGFFDPFTLISPSGALAIRGHSFLPGADDPGRGYGFTRAPLGLPKSGQQVAWGALQYGRTQKIGSSPYGKLPTNGDRYKVVLDIGIPTFATPGTGAPSISQDTMPIDLKVNGLERIYFAMCSVGVAFAANTPPGLTPEYLYSTPVGPATAPRQHVKGTLFAVLTRD